jgi:hypothetical protein
MKAKLSFFAVFLLLTFTSIVNAGGYVACSTNSQCSDGNSQTIDTCNLAGTLLSYCSNVLNPFVVCGGAEQIIASDLLVVGEGCYNYTPPLPTQDSIDIGVFQTGTYEIYGIVQRGRFNDPLQCQTGEEFYVEINGQQSQVIEDDANACTVVSAYEFLGEFDLSQGTVYDFTMHTATSCPPQNSPNSVDLDYICLFFQEPPIIECNTNSECGNSGYLDNNYCLENNLVRDYLQFTCNNPGTPQSFCSQEESTILVEECSYMCSNGACLPPPEIDCYTNDECGFTGYISGPFCSQDGVYQTYQTSTCHYAGTSQSFCSTETEDTLIEYCEFMCSEGECQEPPVICNQDSDCGFTGLIDQPFCSGNNLKKNFQTATCNSPGTSQSSCSLSTSEVLIEECSYMCSNGACLPPPIACHLDSDCDDQNNFTTDSCVNPSTPQSFCENTPIPATIQIISPESRTYNISTIDIILLSNYPNITYTIDNGTSTQYTNQSSVILPEGSHTIVASVTDSQNNIVSSSVTFTIDLPDQTSTSKKSNDEGDDNNYNRNQKIKSNAPPIESASAKSPPDYLLLEDQNNVIVLNEESKKESALNSFLTLLIMLAIILIVLIIILAALR